MMRAATVPSLSAWHPAQFGAAEHCCTGARDRRRRREGGGTEAPSSVPYERDRTKQISVARPRDGRSVVCPRHQPRRRVTTPAAPSRPPPYLSRLPALAGMSDTSSSTYHDVIYDTMMWHHTTWMRACAPPPRADASCGRVWDTALSLERVSRRPRRRHSSCGVRTEARWREEERGAQAQVRFARRRDDAARMRLGVGRASPRRATVARMMIST